MTEYTVEDGLKLLNIAGISLPNGELDTFKSEFNKIYESSEKSYNFVESVWKVYSEILPVAAHPDDLGSSDIRRLVRDKTFQSKVIDSGISEKLKSGVSLNDLVKKSNSFS
jgi:hypothetical protein